MPQWLVVTQQQVADTATYRDVMMRVWYHSTQGVSDNSNSFSTSGDHPPNLSGVSVNINVPGSGGQGASQLIHERTTRITKQYGSSTSVYAAAWLSGINYWGAGQEIYANHTYTVPARPYVVPNAPGTPSVTRVSDARHTLAWTRNATTAGPYTSQRVRRRVYTSGGWGEWATVANVSGSATSYTDASTAANRVYQYYIQAVNSAGSSNSPGSDWAYTTPAAPKSVAATKLSSGDVRVRVTMAHVSPSVSATIQHSANGGSTWAALATVGGNAPTVDYVHMSPSPTQTHRYRVRVTNITSGVGNGLASGWALSGVVQLAAPPNRPTGLGPSTPHDATEPRTLYWTHSPVDGSEQEAFEVFHRELGGSWVTAGKIVSDGQQWVLPAGTYENGSVVEWEVRTWGQHASPSPRSATASFVTSARPTVAISSPEDGDTLAASTLTVEWAYFQEHDRPQSQWRAQLVDADDVVVETRQGSGATSRTTFVAPVQDGQSYVVRVQVASADGLWSEWDETHFDVEYLPPALAFIAELEWDRDDGTVSLAVEPDVWDGVDALEPVAVTVHRSSDGGDTWEVVADAIPLGGGITSVVDATPPTRGDLLYRATAISALPSMAVGEPVQITVNETERAYLSYGSQFENVLVFYGNLKRSTTTARDEVIENFAGRAGADGRPAGVIISGETRTRDLSVAATLLMADGLATAEDFEDAAMHGGLMCLRTPDGVSGRRVFGMMSPVSSTSEFAPLEGVQFAISETGRG